MAIDEGQFYQDLTEWADILATKGKTVIVAALDGNFLNHPFSRHFQVTAKSHQCTNNYLPQ